MTARTRNLWTLALIAAPFMLANTGCYDSDDSQGTGKDLGEAAGNAGSNQDEKRPAELELCEDCKDPAPASPDIQCADGSTEGFVCAKKDLGDCGWLYRACPSDGDDGGARNGSGALCGGRAGASCAKGEYCQYDASCGAADQAGTCTMLPTACDLVYAPVCGCDGKTYGNACEAASSGVSIVAQGECQGAGSGDFCGGLIGKTCSDGEYCQYDSSCGRADQGGRCTETPDGCAEIYAPVCGCDGKTYGNACEAASSGMSVARKGACDSMQPCSSCQDPAPGAPNYKCSDGSIGGPACVFVEERGQCGWVILECPISRDPCQGFECKPGYHCTAPADAPSCVPDVTDCNSGKPPGDGSCWRDGDCAKGKTCVGASCCPVNVACFAPDKPGMCQ